MAAAASDVFCVPVGTAQVLQATHLPSIEQPASLLGHDVAVLDRLADPDEWLTSYGASVRCLITHAMAGVPTPLMERLPALGLIASAGAGVERIDLGYAAARGIMVTASGDVLADDVADLAMLHCLTLFRRTAAADAFVRSGAWLNGSYPIGRSLGGRHLGILGFGRIGRALARRAQAFGMLLGYHSRRQTDETGATYFANALALAHWADIVCVALPGGRETKGFVGRAMLDALGPQAYLVNVARGEIVDEIELAAALVEGRIAGAGLDVYVGEPTISQGLLTAPNLYLTPHLGTATYDTRRAMLEHVVFSVVAFLRGESLTGIVD